MVMNISYLSVSFLKILGKTDDEMVTDLASNSGTPHGTAPDISLRRSNWFQRYSSYSPLNYALSNYALASCRAWTKSRKVR